MFLKRKSRKIFKSLLLICAMHTLHYQGLYAQSDTEELSTFNPGDELEMRGHYRLRGNWKFNIYHKKNQTSKWLQIGQRSGDCILKAYNEKEKKLLIEKDGAMGGLSLNKIEAASSSTVTTPSSGGNSISSTNLRFKNGLYYELGKENAPFTGSATKKYPTGKPWYQRGYKDGKKHGATMEWFPNGQIKYKMIYTDNQRTGVWTYWNQEGKVTAKRQYEKNQFIKNLPLK
jgi:antitoxin component YwqK of YwqJK toxin-antitoxin module